MERTRRQLLGAVGLSSIGLLAGCVGGQGRTACEPATDTDGAPPKNKLFGPDGNTDDNFGNALAMSADGSTAIVGAERRDRTPTVEAGVAYVFEVDGETGSVAAELTPDDRESSMDFGEAVAVSADGSTAVVGASGAGKAYVFGRSGDGWSQEAELGPSDSDDDSLGMAVGIASDGSTVLVGGFSSTVPVFRRTAAGWTREHSLSPPADATGSWFGAELAIDGDGTRALIANSEAPGPEGRREGEVYDYRLTDGAPTRGETLQMPPAESSDHFGISVALSDDGTTAVIGSDRKTDTGPLVDPTAHVFEHRPDGWRRLDSFAADGDTASGFATAVAVSADGDTALVGGRLPDSADGTPTAGPQLLHRTADGWSAVKTFTPDDESRSFGTPVALAGDGRTALVGARVDDGADCRRVGAAYVFAVPAGP
ncbi:FG-GAP repeat protein [Haloarcula salinisoli]|uniref:FG-GAP repeat protein n=1 Tax=Haloarcula salinisoli TaxID=2487746 RepID=A0A8J7YFV5_9EURY|nr:FG-GAP repeat protein [Halomicroarcula salinisoli]MBX0304717.1 FG-GAP repeat protein [Halomicroarcula salinisoli]